MRNRLAVLTLVAANALGVAVAPTAAWINKPAAATPILTTMPAGPAHEGSSQISGADCLTRLDNYRGPNSASVP